MNRTILHPVLTWLFLLACSALSAQTTTIPEGNYLLVIDMQEINTKSALAPEVAQKLIDNVNRAIEQTDPEKVIYVEAVMSKLAITLGGPQVEVLPGMFLDDRLKLVNDVRIVKTMANTFQSKPMKSFIEAHQPAGFVLVGAMAEHCVRATALGGLEAGFVMTIIPEAIAGESGESLSKITNELQQAGVKVLPLSEL